MGLVARWSLFACMQLLVLKGVAQLTVGNTLTPDQLVQQILVGQGITVNNVTFNGVPAGQIHDQAGTFNGQSSAVGLASGMVLATGRLPVITGPNTDMSAALSPASSFNTADPDLLLISSTTTLRDQAVLEFDFVPLGDTVSFRFVFGSEEYPEFVCSQWNDVFGFFLSGPGLSGPFQGNGVNLALVPGSVVPIAINTINSGAPGVLGGGAFVCAASDPNWQNNSIYYVDNTAGTTLELDGFTVPLTAGARVQCGQTYHIKIALADAGDSSVDSAVLLEGGSFSSLGGVSVQIATPFGDGVLTEGCGEAVVTVDRQEANDELVVLVEARGGGGSANDVLGVPSSLTLEAGQRTTSFSFQAIEDALAEGVETLAIIVLAQNACGDAMTDTAWVDLHDYAPMNIVLTVPPPSCDPQEVELAAAVSGGLGQVDLLWSTGTSGGSIRVPGTVDATYTLQATDRCPRTVVAVAELLSGCELDIPNVITPNGDGTNDAWVVRGIEHFQHRLRIYNRWGQVLLETSNYRNDWRGGGSPDGTYFYEIVTARDGRNYTGVLTVLGTD